MAGVSAASFYAPSDDLLVASELTRGPWSAHHQHGGPVAAALARAVEREMAGSNFRIVRTALEIARPVPIAPLRVATRVLHRGRTVATVEATAEHEQKLIAKANMLLIAARELTLPDLPRTGLPPGIALPDSCPPFELPFELQPVGYHTGMAGRVARRAEPGGRVFVWMKMNYPLVPGETPSPLMRVMIAADSTNGVSAILDPTRFLYTNADLVVALGRPPAGEWIGLDAITRVEPSGIGLSDAELFDEQGPIGRVTQCLVILPV